MDETLHASELAYRLAAFAAVAITMAIAERFVPRQRPSGLSARRWLNNLGLASFNALTLRMASPILPISVAILVQQKNWGLFHQISPPHWLATILSLLTLDLAIYVQHVVFHTVPWLWRLHRVHHSDPELDLTTGLRFHTLEIALSSAIKAVIVALLGAPAVAVLAFEIALNSFSIFNHSNIALSNRADSMVRLIVVSPDMHRIHHSVDADEHNSNFGFSVSCWDRIFRTYRDQPRTQFNVMSVGLAEFRSPCEVWLHRLLMQPWRRSSQ